MDACCMCNVFHEHEDLYIICDIHCWTFYCDNCIYKLKNYWLSCRCGMPFEKQKLLDRVMFITLPPDDEYIIIKVEKIREPFETPEPCNG